MASSRIGIWLIGARGGVASTATLGLIGLNKGLVANEGLVSQLPLFAGLDLAGWDRLAVGGHEIRSEPLVDSLRRLHLESRVLDASLIDACQDELAEVDARIRPGSLAGCGQTIDALADESMGVPTDETPREMIARTQRDLREFQADTGAERVIVVNLASTEPVAKLPPLPSRWEELDGLLDDRPEGLLPASSLYAIAALDAGMPYVNFTPSLGASPAAIGQLAELRGTCHAGQDGKTGETLLKSALAPMFAARNFQVLSWVGHNIFGNLDSEVLDDPASKAAKVENKDRLLGRILGYDPQTLITIESIRSMGDWKTAWDHIHFRGFLGTPMVMQFIWQGCDSLLAAPLVLDLVRLVELAARRGETGLLAWLGSFFKRPLGLEEDAFFRQFALLEEWAARHSS